MQDSSKLWCMLIEALLSKITSQIHFITEFFFSLSIFCVLVSAFTLEMLLWVKSMNQMIWEGISILCTHRPLFSSGGSYLSHGKAGVRKRKIFVYVISQVFGALYLSNFVFFTMTLGASKIRCLKRSGI